MTGKIELFLGPMFSGKTTSIIERVKKFENRGKEVRVYKPVVDNRYGKDVSSHDNKSMKARNIVDIKEVNVENVDVVVIDEYFFLKDTLLNYCKLWKEQGKHVIIAGLDLNYRGDFINFLDSEKTSEDLMQIADKINFLKSKCAVCGKEATMTERTVESDNSHLVGGVESYRPVCKEHHPKWKK